MSQLRKPLTAGAVDEYANHIIARLDAGDDAAALEASIREFDSAVAGDVVKQRLEQVLNTIMQTRFISTNGQVSAVIATAGTGYSVGDVIPIVGDGQGGAITVTQVGDVSGDILAIEVTGGEGYVDTASADSTGVGGEDATFTVSISNKTKTLEDVRAAIAAAV